MNDILEALFHRRAVKVFEPVKIPQVLREQILDAARHAPSSFNMQPYRFFWVESSARMALLKTKSFDSVQEMTRYAPLPAGMDYRQAIQMLRGEPERVAPEAH